MTNYFKATLSVLLVCCFAACGRKEVSHLGVPNEPKKKIEVLVNRNEVVFRIAHHLAQKDKDFARPLQYDGYSGLWSLFP